MARMHDLVKKQHETKHGKKAVMFGKKADTKPAKAPKKVGGK